MDGWKSSLVTFGPDWVFLYTSNSPWTWCIFFLVPESIVKCRWWTLVQWKPRRPVKNGIHADLCCHFPNAPALHITVTSLSASFFCADEITDIFYSFQKKKKSYFVFFTLSWTFDQILSALRLFYIAAYTIAYNNHAPSPVVLNDGRCFFSPSSSLTKQYRKCTVFAPDPFYSGCDLLAALLLLLLQIVFFYGI